MSLVDYGSSDESSSDGDVSGLNTATPRGKGLTLTAPSENSKTREGLSGRITKPATRAEKKPTRKQNVELFKKIKKQAPSMPESEGLKPVDLLERYTAGDDYGETQGDSAGATDTGAPAIRMREFNVDQFYRENQELKAQGKLVESVGPLKKASGTNQLSHLISVSKANGELLNKIHEQERARKKKKNAQYGFK